MVLVGHLASKTSANNDMKLRTVHCVHSVLDVGGYILLDPVVFQCLKGKYYGVILHSLGHIVNDDARGVDTDDSFRGLSSG